MGFRALSELRLHMALAQNKVLGSPLGHCTEQVLSVLS